MSVLIKSMNKPTECMTCMFFRTDIRNVDWCVLTEKDLPCDCPIVEIPPHGRLVDADAIDYSLGVEDRDGYVHWVLEDAPTIVDAERQEDGR